MYQLLYLVVPGAPAVDRGGVDDVKHTCDESRIRSEPEYVLPYVYCVARKYLCLYPKTKM